MLKRKGTYGLESHRLRFDTEEKCYEFLVQVLWDGRPVCPKCGNKNGNYQLKKRKEFVCGDYKCNKQWSLIKGTIFENTKVPLRKWFQAIYYVTTKKSGVSSYQMAKWLEMHQKTVWFMLQRIREALKNENDLILKGWVQADETIIKRKTSRDKKLKLERKQHQEEQDKLHGIPEERRLRAGDKQKRGLPKGYTKEVIAQLRLEGKLKSQQKKPKREPFEKGAVILGMIEKGGRMIMKKLGQDTRSTNKDNVLPLLQKHIHPDSIFVTDQAAVYVPTSTMFQRHVGMKHKGKLITPDGFHNNDVENSWKHLKRMVNGTYLHISYHHLDGYLNEHIFRWNRREKNEMQLFEEFVPLVMGNRLKYKEMVGRRTTEVIKSEKGY